MSFINYLGGLKKEYHHVKTDAEENPGYEPAMVILHPGKKGKSFIIPIDCFWKYLDPMDTQDALPMDLKEFKKKSDETLRIINLTAGLRMSPMRAQAFDDLTDILLASKIHETTKILPTVAYNLSKCLRMFDITVLPESAAQLLMWIQDGLDTLKNMPDAPPEKDLVEGGISVWVGGEKVAEKDLTVKESDLIIEEGKA